MGFSQISNLAPFNRRGQWSRSHKGVGPIRVTFGNINDDGTVSIVKTNNNPDELEREQYPEMCSLCINVGCQTKISTNFEKCLDCAREEKAIQEQKKERRQRRQEEGRESDSEASNYWSGK